jgi:hypothetical protein
MNFREPHYTAKIQAALEKLGFVLTRTEGLLGQGGMADLIGADPKGKFFAVENKMPGKKLEPLQKVFADKWPNTHVGYIELQNNGDVTVSIYNHRTKALVAHLSLGTERP